jgi:acyl-CoA thioesterase-1
MRTASWSTIIAKLCASASLLAAVAFTGSGQAQSATDSRLVILAIGESTTAGFGVPANQSYPAQLQQLLDEHGYDYRVVNHGRNGSTTEMALSNLHRGMLLRPDIVLIAIGGNDSGNPEAVQRTEDNLRKLVSLFAETDAAVFLAERAPDTDGGDATRNSLYARVASEEGATLMPSLRQDIAGRADLLIDDMRHPNADGYAIIAQRIFNMIEPVLKRTPTAN